MDIVFPHRFTHADMISKLRHKEALSYLWRANKQVNSRIKQTVNNRLPCLVNGIKQLAQCHDVDIIRISHSAHNFLIIYIFALEIFGVFCYNVTVRGLIRLLRTYCRRCIRRSLFIFVHHSSPPFMPPSVAVMRLIVSSRSLFSAVDSFFLNSLRTIASLSFRAL